MQGGEHRGRGPGDAGHALDAPRGSQGPHAAAARRARRDRHGRGLRGPLYPGALPLWRSPAERFFEVAADVVADLSPQWSRHLEDLLLDVLEVPDPSGGTVVLAEVVVEDGAARLRLYRRPLEARAHDEEDLADLLVDVVVEALADHLGIDPDELDPPPPAA